MLRNRRVPQRSQSARKSTATQCDRFSQMGHFSCFATLKPHVSTHAGHQPTMKYWEIIADKLSAAGWTWGYCSAVTENGWRWVVDAYCGDGRRYIVESDELLSAFLELEAIVRK